MKPRFAVAHLLLSTLLFALSFGSLRLALSDSPSAAPAPWLIIALVLFGAAIGFPFGRRATGTVAAFIFVLFLAFAAVMLFRH